ncbi:LysR substrate-binding domain-containing protein [Emcibacter nanhaiensis]|uniref:LysR family transcriptional regulator n=1 Tax=Emcibacter nanhaiensis TaxID=1505037 RepID=A0A501PST6_9PROT|nr:LysR substrate-binding domain-containing protein [Emcibacter nanhaiensis]TPD62781.1 LysR family transcriptional regulator [Emcibacter nanhaiensis]
MTFEQLTIFVAVAERQHLTRAAEDIGLTPSAVSASIKALETFYNVRLFDRVGRGIELSPAGRLFLDEAKATLARANAAEQVLSELGGLRRGRLTLFASQTISSYWLPPRLMQFHQRYPQIELQVTSANTAEVSQAVLEGAADLGFIEGEIDQPALATLPLALDQMVIVVSASHPLGTITPRNFAGFLMSSSWIMREKGSGTRSQFEVALKNFSLNPDDLEIAFTLPSNEAILSALRDSQCAAALSRLVADPYIRSGELRAIEIELPPRTFMAVRHKERTESPAARELLGVCREV